MTQRITPRRTLLVQLNESSARDLYDEWSQGEDFYHPAVDRNADDVALDDLIVFWVTGAADRAGVVGIGVASGHSIQLQHPVTYRDPDGPKRLRPSLDVALAWVGDSPILTRRELIGHEAFGDFELFKMANRPNAFAVTNDQAAVMLGRLKEVLAK